MTAVEHTSAIQRGLPVGGDIQLFISNLLAAKGSELQAATLCDFLFWLSFNIAPRF